MQEQILHLTAEIGRIAQHAASEDALLAGILDQFIAFSGAYQGKIGRVRGQTVTYATRNAYDPVPLDVGFSPTGQSIAEGTLIYVPDVRQHPVVTDRPDLYRDPKVRAELIAPIFYGDEMLGVLNLHSDQAHGFAALDADRSWYAVAAPVAAMAWWNVLEQQRHARLHEGGVALNSLLQTERLRPQIAQLTRNNVPYDRLLIVSFHTDHAQVSLIDEGAQLLDPQPRTVEDGGLVAALLQVQEAIILPELAGSALAKLNTYYAEAASALIAPMRKTVPESRIVGMLCLLRREGAMPFSQRDHSSVAILARDAAVSWDVSRQYARRTQEARIVAGQHETAVFEGPWQALIQHVTNVLRQQHDNFLHMAAFYAYSHTSAGDSRLKCEAALNDIVDVRQQREVEAALDMALDGIRDDQQSPPLPNLVPPANGLPTDYTLTVPVWEWDDENREHTLQLVGLLNVRLSQAIPQDTEDLLVAMCMQAVSTHFYVEQSKRMTRLVHINQTLSRQTPVDILDTIVRESYTLLLADCVALYQHDNGLDRLSFDYIYPSNAENDDTERVGVLSRQDMRFTSLFAGRGNDPEPVSLSYAHELEAPRDMRALTRQFRSVLAAPVWVPLSNGEAHLYGVILVACERPYAFNPDEITALRLLATQASIVFQNRERDKRENQHRFDLNNAVNLIKHLHSFNANLRSVQRTIEKLQHSDHTLKENEIDDATDTLVRLIDMYNTMKKRVEAAITTQRTQIPVDEIIDKLAALCRNITVECDDPDESWRHSVHWQLDLADDLVASMPHVLASDTIFDMFEIILDNAVEAVEESDERFLRVRLQRLDEGHQTCLQVMIRDSGRGMDETTIKHLFDFGFSNKQKADQNSMGLGMWIAQRIVSNNGGDIQVDVDRTRPGEGACLIVTLPTVGQGVE